MSGSATAVVRLDKWLWAARFFRTRTRAKDAVEGGKVLIDGARSKPARELRTGMQVTVRRGDELLSVIVLRLDDERRGATEAQALYAETDASREQRARATALRATGAHIQSSGRPTKRDRRAFERLRDNGDDDEAAP